MERSNRKKLGDLAEIKHGFAFPGKHIVSQETDRILMTPGHFALGGGFRHNHKKYFDSSDYRDGYELASGDLVVTMTDLSKTGDTLGYGAVVPQINDKILLHNQRIGKVVLKTAELDKRFCHYLLRSSRYRQHVLETCTGSTVKHTSPTKILDYEFDLPVISDQKAIAHILGTLDDKIELNQKMNQTLEEIAKAIFKSWFVDFDPVRAKAEGRPTGLPPEISDLFPNELVDSELGEIPKGWEQTTLSEVTSVIGRGVTPKYCDEGVAILNQKCIRNWSINSNLARSTSSEKKYKEEKYLQEYDCVINSTGVGTLGRVAICDSRQVGMLCDSHVSIVRGITPDTSIFTSMRLGLMEPEIENLGHGSTGQTELSRTAIGDIGVTMPSPEILKETKSLLSPFIERRRLLDLENESLSELRDTLLPKLISGELRIPDAVKFLEEAGV